MDLDMEDVLTRHLLVPDLPETIPGNYESTESTDSLEVRLVIQE